MICFSNLYTKYLPLSKSFRLAIWFSFSNKANRIIVIPVEKISLFSGLNSPKPDFEYSYSNSGDIYNIVPLAFVFANVVLLYLDSPKSDSFILYLLLLFALANLINMF